MPGFIAQITKWGNDLIERYPAITDYVNSSIDTLRQINWTEQLQNLLDFLKNGNLLDNTFSVASSIIGGMTNAVIGLIFAFYLLLQKKSLLHSARRSCMPGSRSIP